MVRRAGGIDGEWGGVDMSATHWGMVFTLLTGVAAGAAATAWDDRQIALAVGATLIIQILAIACFLLGSRRQQKNITSEDARKNGLTPLPLVDTMVAPNTDNNQTGIET
jgi:hypothetical protein